MEGNELNVTKTEQFATFRQVVTPVDQANVVDTFSTLLRLYREGKITGALVVNFNQGGVRNFVTDQLARIRSGSDADKAFEELFGK